MRSSIARRNGAAHFVRTNKSAVPPAIAGRHGAFAFDRQPAYFAFSAVLLIA